MQNFNETGSLDTGYFFISQLIDELEDLISEDVDRSKLEARIASIAALYDIQPKKPAAGHPDVVQHVEQYLSAIKLEGFSGHTLNSYERHLKHFAESMSKPLAEITTQDIRNYLASFDHLKPRSIATKIWTIKAFFTWLVEEDILEVNPMRKIKPPKIDKPLPKSLNIEELELIREYCETKRERAMIEVFYSTGGRLEEVQSSDKKDIDWSSSSLRVIGKGNKERDVYLSARAKHYLKRYIDSRDDSCEALFITHRKPYRRLCQRQIQKDIKKIADRAGIEKNVHPHILRHTFATLTLNNGAEMSVIQELLGHSSPTSTQIYAQVTDERKKETHKKHFIQ